MLQLNQGLLHLVSIKNIDFYHYCIVNTELQFCLSFKTIKILIMKNLALNITSILFLLFAFSFNLNAQNGVKKNYSQDPLFPTKKNSLVMVGTGIPYVGIAEYTYGFSDKF
jgi:hypothetical protein